MKITCSLKGCHLQWILPSEVKDLYVQCASKDYKTKECDTFEERGRRTIPKNVQNNYARFKPVGYVKPQPPRSRESFISRSHSRSHSHSQSKNNITQQNNKKENMTKHNDNKADNSNADPNESSPSSNRKSVTYAEHIASLSLQTSIHTPSKHTTATKPVTLPSTQLNLT